MVSNPKRTRELISPKDWESVSQKYEALSDEEKKVAPRYELSMHDKKWQVLAIIHNRFGEGEVGFHRCQAAGGPHWTTMRDWENIEARSAQASKLRQAAWVSGYDMEFVKRKK